jgi:hypothetical protein
VAQGLAASVAAPIGGGAPQDEAGLGACTDGLVKQPPMDGNRPLAPAIKVGQRRCCGMDGTWQTPAATVCWNCRVEQTPPPPAAKPATGQHQIQRCRSSGTKNAPRALEAKPVVVARPLLCEPGRRRRRREIQWLSRQQRQRRGSCCANPMFRRTRHRFQRTRPSP